MFPLNRENPAPLQKRKLGIEFALILLLLLAIVSLLLFKVFLPDYTLFSNDGPLAQQMAQCHQLPGRFTGCWDDLGILGSNSGSAPPNISFGLDYLLKPILFSKYYAFFSIVFLGLGAWCFFVNLRLSPAACILGSLATALNSCFFSVACWGVAAQTITPGLIFLALAALTDETSRLRWLRAVLAGLAVGMAVVEGADVGAIYSMYAAAFVIYQACVGAGPWSKKLAIGLGRLGVVALFAGLVAATTVVSLVNTYIKGVVGMQQDVQTKDDRWDWATQWSLPIPEFSSLIVPGLYGFRMDTPNGGAYWGDIGRAPAVDRYIKGGEVGKPPVGFLRYSGGGFYAGVPVVLLCVWAIAQMLRRKESVFNLSQRKWLWFWLGVVIISTLLAFGRYAPFYQLIYALPYFSTIRNPIKFINLVSLGLVVIFAFGVDGIWRRYMQQPVVNAPPPVGKQKNIPVKKDTFEKYWLYGCMLVLGLSVLLWIQYASNRENLSDYLQTVQFNATKADAIASFSIRQAGWFILLFALSAGLIIGISKRKFTGSRAKIGVIALGILLVADLGLANLPWVVYWNYPEKYASNPVIDFLRNEPYEHRVALIPSSWRKYLSGFNGLYREVWMQQLFPYYNIQSLDVVNMSRVPQDLKAYFDTQGEPGLVSFVRLWRLTNTRYILGPSDALDTLNHMANVPPQSFRIVKRFDIVLKDGNPNPNAITADTQMDEMTAVTNDNGAMAVYEFTSALPRAKLYSNWEVNTNDQAVLAELGGAVFNPDKTVLVSDELPPPPAQTGASQNAGTVDIVKYAPKDITLKSDAATPTVLLLNDQYDPGWKVMVDGQSKPLLRCNFIVRGVYLTAGRHTVEFRFRSQVGMFHFGLAVIIGGLLILAVFIVLKLRMPEEIQQEIKPAQEASPKKAETRINHKNTKTQR